MRCRRQLTSRLSVQSYFLVSAVFHYLGPSFAVLLFSRVGVLGVAWLRIVTAAVVFAAWRRPWRLAPRLDRRGLGTLAALGTVLAAMNCLFYLAVDRLPLSTVGAIEFLGTVLLAALGVRTKRNAAALVLTTGGVAVITQIRFTGQPLGFVFAFGNCALFMAYVVLGHRIANSGSTQGHKGDIGGVDRLGAAMLVAAVVVMPAGLGQALSAFARPMLLLAGAGVGVCSSVIPYVTDQLAMASLPRATFALMLGLLPMFAALIGALVLHQIPTIHDLGAIALVTVGVALHRPDSAAREPLVSRPSRPAAYGATAKKGANDMEFVRLGSSGLKVSRIGLGMMSYGNPALEQWILSEDRAEPIVRRAVTAGVTFFDTADIYSNGMSEEITGRLLAKFFSRRDDYVLATKVYYPTGSGPNDRGLSRKHVLASIDASLARLGTDYVDIYQIHRWDDQTPIEETMAALHDVVRAGKARYIGASAMAAWQFAKAQYTASSAGWTTFSSMQNRYNLVNREDEREMIPLCVDQGVGIIPYSPLARGLLAGTRDRSGQRYTPRARADEPDRPEDFAIVDEVRAVAAQHDVPAAQVSLAWLLSKPWVCVPIVGATKPSHVDDAVAAETVILTKEEIARLEAPYLPRLVTSYA